MNLLTAWVQQELERNEAEARKADRAAVWLFVIIVLAWWLS